jgi:hypothetical protein
VGFVRFLSQKAQSGLPEFNPNVSGSKAHEKKSEQALHLALSYQRLEIP